MKVVKLLYFAGVREAIGRSAETIELPDGVDDIGSLRRHVGARGAPWSLLEADRGWRFAVNRDMADSIDAPIGDGDEVAIFPPVTGDDGASIADLCNRSSGPRVIRGRMTRYHTRWRDE